MLDPTAILLAGQRDGEFGDFPVDSLAVALRGAVTAVVDKILREPDFDARGYGEDLVEIFGRVVGGHTMSTVAIVAVGSRGDVAPLTGVGVALQEAGHRVVVAAYTPFANLITGCGLEFRELPTDFTPGDNADVSPKEALAAMFTPSGVRDTGQMILNALHDVPADILLLPPLSELAGHPLAEAMGIPSLGVRMQPLSATAAYPPTVLGAWSAGSRRQPSGRLYRRVDDRPSLRRGRRRFPSRSRAAEPLNAHSAAPAHECQLADPARLFAHRVIPAGRLAARPGRGGVLVARADVLAASAGADRLPGRRPCAGVHRPRQHGGHRTTCGTDSPP